MDYILSFAIAFAATIFFCLSFYIFKAIKKDMSDDFAFSIMPLITCFVLSIYVGMSWISFYLGFCFFLLSTILLVAIPIAINKLMRKVMNKPFLSYLLSYSLSFIVLFSLILNSMDGSSKTHRRLENECVPADTVVIEDVVSSPSVKFSNNLANIELKTTSIDSIWIEKDGAKKAITLEQARKFSDIDLDKKTFFLKYDTINTKHEYVKKCKSTKDFHELVERPYVYSDKSYDCDVNLDGLTDYILEVDHEADTIRNQEASENHNRGLILAINKGDYFETEHIYFCLLPYQILIGYYDEIIEASQNRLSINASYNSHSTESYDFVYKDGDFVLCNYHMEVVTDFTETQSYTKIDFVHNSMTCTTRIKEDSDDGDNEVEDKWISVKYSIEDHKPLLLSRMGVLLN